MKIIYLTFLAGVALVAPIHAESFEEHFGVGPGQLTAANVRDITGYSTMQAAVSAYLCSEDMARRDREVRADHEAYNKHLQDWIEASRPKQIPNLVTKDNHGNITETYDTSHPVILSPR